MRSSLSALVGLVSFVWVGPAHGQAGAARSSAPISLDAPLPAPLLPPPGYGDLPPGVGSPPAYPRRPQASPLEPPFPASALGVARPTWKGPIGWLRFGASFGACPYAGKMEYDLVYRGEVIDKYSGSPAQSPSVSLFAEAQLTRLLLLGLSVQYNATVKWAKSQPTSTGSSWYAGSGYELDFLPRLGLTLPLVSRIRLLASGAPGYSVIEASDLAKGPFGNPRTLKGFVVQGDVRVMAFLARRVFAQVGVSCQWGFQHGTVRSATSTRTATARLRSTFFGLHAGIGYWL